MSIVAKATRKCSTSYFLIEALESGGKPSTRLPPGKLVEHFLFIEAFSLCVLVFSCSLFFGYSCLTSSPQAPASSLQPRASSLQPQASSPQPPASDLQPPTSNLQPPSSLQPPASSLQPSASSFSLQPAALSLQPLALHALRSPQNC